MGYHYYYLVVLYPVDGLHEEFACRNVHPGRGFVEDEYGCVSVEESGECYALPLAHAEFGAAVEGAAEHIIVSVGESFYYSVSVRKCGYLSGRFSIIEGDIFFCCQRIACKVLEEDGNVSTKFVEGEAAYVGTIDEDLPLLRVIEAQQEFDEGAFAVAILALYKRHLPHPGCEVVVLQDVAFHIWIAKGHVAEFHSLYTLGDGQRGCWREDLWLEVKEVEKVCNEKAVVVERRYGGYEGGEVALTSAEGLKEHDKGADADSCREGLANEQPDDGKHGGSLDDAAENVERSQSARDGQQLSDQLSATIDEAVIEN